MWTRIVGYACIAAAIALGAFIMYRASGKANETLLYSPPQILSALWADYKGHFLESESGRTLDPSRENITTSEGQSYTLLRAVWMGDRVTFDKEWTWTKSNLGHNQDHLFSWLFGKRPDGTYGVLTSQNGSTSATDADTDIALSLVFAFARWQDPQYLDEARAIINDIWTYEVIDTNPTLYLASNNIEKGLKSDWMLTNPSYFHPAAYRIFARVDPTHPWLKLAKDSYTTLNASMTSPLGTAKSAHLPPDWVEVNVLTGALRAPQNAQGLTTNFGFDALRAPWRVALDAEWFGTKEASSTLAKMSTLTDEWQSHREIHSVYTHAGDIVTPTESPAMYGGSIGYFAVTNPALARQIFEEKLTFLFSPGSNTWKERLSYYDDNWAWFGIGLYSNLLPNLAASIPPGAYQK
jgi:endo-1,4-beta-D-glucanase Y